MIYITTPDRNFGDSLNGPILSSLFGKENVFSCNEMPPQGRRLAAIGSIAHLMIGKVAIWGAGALTPEHISNEIDGIVYASRGKLSKDGFSKAGYEMVSEAMCDPGVLAVYLWREVINPCNSDKIVYMPHKNDSAERTSRICRMVNANVIVHPAFTSTDIIMHEISSAKLVVSSSLHGVIVAEGYGKPAIALQGEFENSFKYFDYFSGTGREGCGIAEEKDLYGKLPNLILPKPQFDIYGLLTNIPKELSLEVNAGEVCDFYSKQGVLK